MATATVIKRNIEEPEEHICRMCLTNEGSFNDMVGLFDLLTSNVLNMYIDCTSLPANEFDGISEYICSTCYKNLVDFHSFRITAIESYHFLCERRAGNQLEFCKSENENVLFCEPVIKEEQNILLEDFTETFHNNNKLSSEMGMVAVNRKRGVTNKVRRKKDKKSSNGKMICDICQKEFFKKHRLEGHLRKHLGLKPFQCDICEDKQFSKWFTFKEHMNLKHTDTEKVQYKCIFDGCNKSYLLEVNYKINFVLSFKKIVERKL